MTTKANCRSAGNATAATDKTATNHRQCTPEAARSQAPQKLTPAIERALQLMRAGMRPGLANIRAAGEFRLDVTDVARRTGAVAAEARLARKARREAQERRL